ncbi:hypothetical protein [Dryocola sp. BD626]|uniref:hypothetical protein n=1 Tax=Dryocola sp. BD626 TaxID=3133273 RepID=UPI003F50CDA9
MQRLNDMSTSELVTTARNYSASITEIGIYSELVKEITDRLAANTAAVKQALKERDALAADNSKMLQLLTDISDNHGEFVNDADDYLYASVQMDYVSEINMYVSRDVNAENPFAATDTALADIEARGVEKGIAHLLKKFEGTGQIGVPIMALEWFAAELRKGAELNHG